MLKPISMLLAFLLCSLLGIQRASSLHERAKLLELMQNDVRRLMIAMEFERKPLVRILSARTQGELRPLWQSFAAALQGGLDTRSAFLEALMAADAEITGFHTIGGEERTLLTEFAAALGGTDLDGQKKNAAMLLAGLAPLAEQARAECGVKGRVYRVIGMLSGATVVILML